MKKNDTFFGLNFTLPPKPFGPWWQKRLGGSFEGQKLLSSRPLSLLRSAVSIFSATASVVRIITDTLPFLLYFYYLESEAGIGLVCAHPHYASLQKHFTEHWLLMAHLYLFNHFIHHQDQTLLLLALQLQPPEAGP